MNYKVWNVWEVHKVQDQEKTYSVAKNVSEGNENIRDRPFYSESHSMGVTGMSSNTVVCISK